MVGFLSSGLLAEAASEQLTKMSDTIVHRGPDDAGYWIDAEAGVALSARRLCILDLSPAGHQPMASASGRYVIAYNGEIYNHRDLRQQIDAAGRLPAIPFRGHSDTEVLLSAIERWGLRGTLERCIGMFAFALWDRQARVLHLVRDRLGEKPLYYGWLDSDFVFGSELKALRRHHRWRQTVDPDALALFLRYQYVPGPYSIYTGIKKLPPGSVLSLPWPAIGSQPEPVEYWSARAAVATGLAEPFSDSEAAAVDQLDGLLRSAVSWQMLADVPVGAFLSGGIDSSLVVSLMQALGDRPARTFTIAFDVAGYDEAGHARAVARHLGTDHTQMQVTSREALEVIPRMPSVYDEPFADASQIPTYLVASLARRAVTVSLSGDAGDELFGGYQSYFATAKAWRALGWLPRPVRQIMGRTLRAVPARVWDTAFGWLAPCLEPYGAVGSLGDKVHKLSEVIGAESLDTFYGSWLSHWRRPQAVMNMPAATGVHPVLQTDGTLRGSVIPRLMYIDLLTYLPDDILVKLDRASMAVSLESRVPFLDHRVVEFAWRLPFAFKVRDGSGKRILRQLLSRYVPPALTDRRKHGFSVPMSAWLRGPLRDWAADLLHRDRLAGDGFLDPRVVSETWIEHQRGVRNWQHALWTILMFQAWLRSQ